MNPRFNPFAPGRWGLIWVLMVPFTLLTTLTTGIVGYLSFRSGEEAADTLADQFLKQNIAQVEGNIQDYLQIPHQVNQLLAVGVEEGWLQPENQDSEQYLWQVLKQYPTLSWVYYGRAEDGAFVGARRIPDGTPQIMVSDSTTQFRRGYSNTNNQGQRRGALDLTSEEYDARQRPWYQEALTTGFPSWTDLYPSATTGELLITASVPVFSAYGFLGVVGADLAVGQIRRFLSDLEIVNLGGGIFILDAKEQLVASSIHASSPTSGPASGTNLPDLGQILPVLQAQGIYTSTVFGLRRLELEVQGHTYYLAVSSLRDPRGLDWMMLMILPERVVMGPLWTGRQMAVGLGFTFSLLSVVICFLISQRLSHPIRQLSDASTGIAQGELQLIDERSPVKEMQTLSTSFNHMSTQLQRSFADLKQLNAELEQRVEQRTQELQASEATFRGVSEFLNQLIDTLPELIVVRDREHRTRLINRAYGEFFYGSTNRESLIGTNEASRFGEFWEQIVAENNQVFTQGTEMRIPPAIQVNMVGEERWIQYVKRPLDLPESDQPGVMLVGSDITDLKLAQDKAEAANRAKSTFLANMSHELRTPLNAIIGFSQLLSRDPQLTDKQRQTLTTINRSGEHLLALINDVLDMAKIEAGKLVLQEEAFDLHDTLKTLRQMLEIRAREKGLKLTLEQDPNLPQMVISDGKKLRQVLINLMGNAVKFTHEGGVTLQARRLPDTDPVQLEFTVSDTGLGMTPEELGMLFQAFVQTDTSKKVSEGTGLGLAISRQFVQLMGGDIQVTSEKGMGSSFCFTIQVKAVDASAVAQAQEQEKVIGLAPGQPLYRLLVVDDVADNRDILNQLLTSVGFQVREACHGQEAIQIWQEWDPHLIWMDIRMPVMDGFEATRQIKSQLQGRQTRVIALSASGFEHDRERAEAAGFDQFVMKPFREATIFQVLQDQLGVEFVYQSAQAATPVTVAIPEPQLLTEESLQVMPMEWIQQFHQAAISLHNRRMKQLLEQIPPEQDALKTILTTLVRKVQIDTILAVTTAVLHKK